MKVIITLVLIVSIAAGCSKHEVERETVMLETAQVATVAVSNETITSTEMVVATIRPETEAVIAAQITAPIQDLKVSLGDVVQEGDLLIKLNETEIRARLIKAEAELKRAENELSRVQALFQRNASNQRELDAATANFDVSQAQVEEAQTILGYTEIRAPFDGVITHRHINQGDLATPGRPLLVLEDPKALRAEAEVPEALLPNLKPGQEVPVVIDSRQIEMTGRVIEISPAADPASRTFLTKIELPTNDQVRSGQFARVGIPAGEREVLRVPTEAILNRGQLAVVFTAEGGRGHMRIIKVGKQWDDEVEVLAGLEAGEQVIVSGHQTLQDGQPVEITP